MDQWPSHVTAQSGRTMQPTWGTAQCLGRTAAGGQEKELGGDWVAHSPSMHLLHSKFSTATAVLEFSYMMSDGTLVLKIFLDWVISSMHHQKQLEALDCAAR